MLLNLYIYININIYVYVYLNSINFICVCLYRLWWWFLHCFMQQTKSFTFCSSTIFLNPPSLTHAFFVSSDLFRLDSSGHNPSQTSRSTHLLHTLILRIESASLRIYENYITTKILYQPI